LSGNRVTACATLRLYNNNNSNK